MATTIKNRSAELTKYDAELEERYTTQSAIVRDELSARPLMMRNAKMEDSSWDGRNATSTFAGRERAVSDEWLLSHLS